MSSRSADVVICGAGIAGVCAAYWLAVRSGISNVVLVDEGAPLSLTSDKSTEAYRNWWPGPTDGMIRYMNRNIDLLEEFATAAGTRVMMNRRGYMYTTADTSKVDGMLANARMAQAQGAGDVRVYRKASELDAYCRSSHMGFANHPTGADLFLGQDAIRTAFPYLADDIVAVLHARRCGWLSGQQLGMFLLDEARAAGVEFVSGRVASVDVVGNRVAGVNIECANGPTERIATGAFVNAAGPYAKHVAQLVGVELPLFSELHLKFAFDDTLGVVDRDAGMIIFDDAQTLEWTDEERIELASDDSTRWLTEPLPAGVHLRPEGYHHSTQVLMLWSYHAHEYIDPEFPLPDDPLFPELVMRGLSRCVPGLRAYLDRLPRGFVDGGYYTKTRENRPLVGPLGVDGAFVTAAFSGFGMMAAPAAAELLAAHITGAPLPSYEREFRVTRYEDPWYQQLLANWGSTGQL